jgi:hypothetical protein
MRDMRDMRDRPEVMPSPQRKSRMKERPLGQNGSKKAVFRHQIGLLPNEYGREKL